MTLTSEEKSLYDIIYETYFMANKIADAYDAGKIKEDDFDSDMEYDQFYSIVDGGEIAFNTNIIMGKCSLENLLHYSLENLELKVMSNSKFIMKLAEKFNIN